MTILDTNFIIRFFTNDNAEQAQIAKDLILSDEIVHVPDVVFPEIEYVFKSKMYDIPRDGILKAYIFLMSRNNIKVSNIAKKAIALYERSNLDMADCFIGAEAIFKNSSLASFDKKLLKVWKNEIELM